ncbi:MAG TPA: anhydro-N-acetylmuramic acid kinase, partial [Nitrococcus sp.]|nr:anhydro-N-acetylmuramic acid kinase [Nitrococcus sp.]
LPGDSAAADITGFDCGPANTLLDAWCRRHRNCSFDTDGIWAAGGILQHTLLERLTSDDFFQCPPPKSTGPEYFNLDWLMRRGGNLLARTSPNDVQTTLAELTAITVARAIRESPLGPGEVLVCGGGVHNRHLLVRLSAHLPEYRIRSTAELGMDPDFVEAAAFAWLARCRLYNVAGNIPAVTGARRRVVLGGIYAGNSHVE